MKVCVFKLHEWDDEQMLLSRQPVLHTHDELYMQTLIDESAVQAFVHRGCRIEDFDRWKHAEFPHLCRQAVYQRRNSHERWVGKFTEPVESEAMSGLR